MQECKADAGKAAFRSPSAHYAILQGGNRAKGCVTIARQGDGGDGGTSEPGKTAVAAIPCSKQALARVNSGSTATKTRANGSRPQ